MAFQVNGSKKTTHQIPTINNFICKMYHCWVVLWTVSVWQFVGFIQFCLTFSVAFYLIWFLLYFSEYLLNFFYHFPFHLALHIRFNLNALWTDLYLFDFFARFFHSFNVHSVYVWVGWHCVYPSSKILDHQYSFRMNRNNKKSKSGATKRARGRKQPKCFFLYSSSSIYF